MKIAVLNECFLSEANISYLKSIGDVELFDDTTNEKKAITRITGKDIVFADMYECPLNKNTLSHANNLKLLCLNTTGYDQIDADTISRYNIKVANTPSYSTEAVAEHTFALLLSLSHHIVKVEKDIREKPFQINPADKRHYDYLGFNLHGKTIGIIGLGAIGCHVAKIANGFGMKVIGYNRNQKSISNITNVKLNDLFKSADIITLHTPLNKESENIINAHSIEKMKQDVLIINTSRAGCIASKDLAQALTDGKVLGAGLDVLDNWEQTPLLRAPRTIITPHSAWFTKESLARVGDIMTKNVRAFINKQPCNIVN
ncbi:MAG: D-2-hydroxyacid dehydrogenase [Alphaproteobacteria bacterium]|nr:D-2-hydroxyacid dehydrogenase [Alphaproteobacteria bacterium]